MSDRLVGPPLHYSREAEGWRPDPEPAPSPPVPVRLLTWNVWFGAHMFEARRAALLAHLVARRPDAIVLQEVTLELLGAILDDEWVRDRYRISDGDGGTLGAYGVLLLSRLPVRRLSLLELPSAMGRALLAAELACGLTVATVHLESMEDVAGVRLVQLGLIQPNLAQASDDVVLAGDMNFAPDDAGETAALEPSFVDVWPALRPDDPGYTVDTDINTMRYQLTGKPARKRIDRVFLRSSRWRAAAIRLIGTDPIDGQGTFVSDHFGVEADLEVAR